MMNFFIKRTFRRFPIIVNDFMNSIIPTFQSLHLEHQLVGPCQPNYASHNQESPNSVFDEVILQMAAPKSKVKHESDNTSIEFNCLKSSVSFLPYFRKRCHPQERKWSTVDTSPRELAGLYAINAANQSALIEFVQIIRIYAPWEKKIGQSRSFVENKSLVVRILQRVRNSHHKRSSE